jgi:glycosyltransferase involved in cell wall biosynthesis
VTGPAPAGDGETMDVLLFSPVRGIDPASGDVAYTEALLDDPPPGVRYTTYDQAVDDGRVRVRGRRPRRGSFGAGDAAILMARGAELSLRRAGVMYREPTWFVTIGPGAFDVVHQHLFAVRQVGRRTPVVSSAGYPLPVLYAGREHWSARRLATATALERAYSRLMDVHNPWLRGAAGNLMTVYTEHFRSYLTARGVDADHIAVCSTALPGSDPPIDRSHGLTLGFVGRDFELKGGDVAVGAYARLRAGYPDLRLRVITGRAIRPHVTVGDGVDVLTDVSSDEVVRDHLPEIDLLLLPTRADCGAPYALLEALRSGTPVITSTFPWLDERLEPPAVTRVAVDEGAVAAAAEALLDPDRLAAAGRAARELWSRAFSMEVLHSQLARAYRQVLRP